MEMRDRGGADVPGKKYRCEKRAGRTEKGGGVRQKCVHLCMCARELKRRAEKSRKEGWSKRRKRKILTDFAVGIGGFSVGTEVRIPPSRSTVCYFKQSPLEPTLLSSERVFITQLPPQTQTLL